MNIIRGANIEDFKSINLISACLGYQTVADLETKQRLNQLINSTTDRVWVYEHAGKLTGWLHAFKAVRLASPHFIEIGGVAIKPNYCRQGMGRKLVNEAVNWAKSENLKIRVRCNADRRQTHKFYEAIGFSKLKSQTVFEQHFNNARG
jgi:N-acetylglutamate synthase-like GNAT family acetyltransferase